MAGPTAARSARPRPAARRIRRSTTGIRSAGRRSTRKMPLAWLMSELRPGNSRLEAMYCSPARQSTLGLPETAPTSRWNRYASASPPDLPAAPGDLGEGLLPRDLYERTVLLDQRPAQPLLAVDVAVVEPAPVAEPTAVQLRIVPADHPQQLAEAEIQVHVAAGR